MSDPSKPCIMIMDLIEVCEGDTVEVRISRERIVGKVSKVSKIGILIDDEILVKISRISWLRVVKNDR